MPSIPVDTWDGIIKPYKRFKCRVHGITNATMIITYVNEHGELVFERRYCVRCYDMFLQQHLDPMVEATDKDINEQPI